MIGKITFFNGIVEKRLLTDSEIIELIGSSDKKLNEPWLFAKNKNSRAIDFRLVVGRSIFGKIGGKDCKFEYYDVGEYEYNLIIIGLDIIVKNVYLREIEFLDEENEVCWGYWSNQLNGIVIGRSSGY